jgi:sugar phosphate isomerase/epimerase
MKLVLSTAPCPARSTAGDLLERWRWLAGEAIGALAVDVRLAAGQRHELLRLLPRHDLYCAQLTHPTNAGRQPPPCPVSDDREERLAARRALAPSLELAADFGVPAVLLMPAELALQPSTGALARLFAEGRDLPLGELNGARAARAPQLLDRLCEVLDPAVELAARLDVKLRLPGPTPWPHQVPDGVAAGQLCEIFAGAPLQRSTFVDWVHCAAALGQPATATTTPSVRLADACGLATRLPLGSGEVDWSAQDAALAAEEGVLTFVEAVRPEEVQRSVALITAQRK